jgi:hypothetical protein
MGGAGSEIFCVFNRALTVCEPVQPVATLAASSTRIHFMRISTDPLFVLTILKYANPAWDVVLSSATGPAANDGRGKNAK